MSRNALLVGINAYERLPPLRSPAKDAEAIAQLLQIYGECSITRLPEVIDAGQPKIGLKTKVSFQELKTALIQLFKPKGANVPQTAFFFFSGHGIQDDSGIQEGFLATSDADPARGFYGLSLSWLRRLLQESPVRQRIIWLDCCNSGEFLNFREADPGATTGTDRLFMTASREYQPAFESLDSPYSIFTQALLNGLNPERLESGIVTNYALTDWVSTALKGEIQQPLFDNSGSEIILTRATKVLAPVEIRQQTTKGICPYKGLSYFDANAEDPKYFYGRTELTDQLLDKVRQGNFLAIVGASGSGKSSVLRAGLLHQLKLGRRLSGSEQWQMHVLVPGKHPLQNLALAFVDSQLAGTDRAKQLADAEELIGKGATGLRQLVQASAASRVILVIDQFEESFTLCQDNAERQQFFQCLLEGLAQTEKLCLILAMRADFFGKCLEQEYSGLAKQIQANMIAVTPMSREELRQAIVEPAKKTGLEVEPELVQEMLTDVEGSPGSLPLLQYTLTELWKHDTDSCLDLRTYSQLGGVMGTLQKRATAVYEQFSDEQKPVVKHLFLALTQLGEGTEDTRRRVLKPDLVNKQYPETLIDQVVQRLADANLIVTNELVEKGITPSSVTIIRDADKVLIQNWASLRKWIKENQNNLKQKQKIEAISASIDQVIQQIANENIVLKNEPVEKITATNYVMVIDVAHEALIRHWMLLKKWIEENRDKLRQKRKIETAAEEWRSRGKPRGYLFQGKQLSDAKVFQQGNSGALPLSVLAEEFIQKGLRQKWRSILLFSVVPAFGVICSVSLAGIYILQQAQIADEKRQEQMMAEYVAQMTEFLLGKDVSNPPKNPFVTPEVSSIARARTLTTLSELNGKRKGQVLKFLYETGVVSGRCPVNLDTLQSTDCKQEKGLYLGDAAFDKTTFEHPMLLPGIDLTRASLSEANLSESDLSQAAMQDATLKDAILTKAILTDAQMNRAELQGANLVGAILLRANLESTVFENADLKGAKLEQANLKGADLYKANLSNTIMIGADLQNANLEGADLSYANLEKADLRNANLMGTNLQGADFKEALYDKDTTRFPKGFDPVAVGMKQQQ
jgi:uncharacterized protein YjbI with pentapeptide repeats/energy-coupling factor transporter ATP-binding protein EcfA2